MPYLCTRNPEKPDQFRSANPRMNIINMKVQISPNFTLEEFTNSSTAKRLGIKNEPNEEQIKNLAALVNNVLQPLRDKLGKPVEINSGFRCPELNKAVGGSSNSQHMAGEAADIRVDDAKDAIEKLHIIMEHGIYDQLLLEFNAKTGAMWIHVSCRSDVNKNHKQVKILVK